MPEDQQRREFLAKGLALGTTVVLARVGLCGCAALAEDASRGTEKQKPLEDLAYCGFDCQKECGTYAATRDNDLKAKEKIAKHWADKYGITIKPQDVACDGCQTQNGRLGYHCGTICQVRKCGKSRGIKSCAVCTDFPTCNKDLWKDWSEMYQRTKERFEQLKGRIST